MNKCPNCGEDNKLTNKKCEKCGTILNSEELDKAKEYKDNKGILIIGISVIFVPILLIILFYISFITLTIIMENKQSKNYLETTANLVVNKEEFCEDNSTTCEETYEYEYIVNDETYRGFPNGLVFFLEFAGPRKNIKVKYNPNNPSEYVMDAKLYRLLIPIVCIFIFFLAVYISALKIFLNDAKKYLSKYKV